MLKNKGYTRLTLQIGRGSYEPQMPLAVAGIWLETYRFKPSLHDDMEKATLIISHGGIKFFYHHPAKNNINFELNLHTDISVLMKVT